MVAHLLEIITSVGKYRRVGTAHHGSYGSDFTSVWQNIHKYRECMADYDPLKKVMCVPVTLHFTQNVYIGGLGDPQTPRSSQGDLAKMQKEARCMN